MRKDSVIRARIDSHTKSEAIAVLVEARMTVSDALRLLLVHVAQEKALPAALAASNADTVKAPAEAARGNGKTSDWLDELLAELDAR